MQYDLIVVGSGPGGYVAAIKGSQLGMKTAVVERAELGGICLNWGCIPTKALMKSAQVYTYMKHAVNYGVQMEGEVKPDFPAMVQRSRGVAETMSKGIQYLLQKNKVDVIAGTAKLTGSHELEVTDKEGGKASYTASHIVLATGARSRVLPNLPQDGKKIIGYREALTLPELPKSMVIVGSGAIGSEFAFFYNSLGVQTTLIELLPHMKNFDRPYTAKTIREFWGRWHISLSTWFRDYLYIPLGGSRCAKWRHLLNITIVFLVSGLWHGAAWTFVIWGALHALYQVIGILTLPVRNRLLTKIGLSPDGRVIRAIRTFNTFLLVDFAWLFFRANSTSDLGKLLSALFTGANWRVPFANVLSLMQLNVPAIVLIVLSLVLLLLLDRLILHHDEPAGDGAFVSRFAFVAVTWIVIFAWTYLMANDLTSTFIYFQF